MLTLADTKSRNKKDATETKRRRRQERERREANPVSPATMAPVQMKLTVAEWEAMLKEIKDLTDEVTAKVTIIKAMHKDKEDTLKSTSVNAMKSIQEEVKRLKATIEGKDAFIKVLQANNTTLTTESQTKDKTIQELRAALKKALAELKEKGKHSKSEESEAVKDGADDWIKKIGYRKWKFAQGKELTKFTSECYDGIKEKLGFTEEGTDNSLSIGEFKRIYTAYCGKRLGDRRQFSQTQMYKAARGKYPKLTDNGPKIKRNLHLTFEHVPLKFGGRGTKLCRQSRNWITSIRFLHRVTPLT